MKIARNLSLLIAMLLCLVFVPASAETMHVATSNVDLEEFFGVTSEELFELYVDNTLYDREMAFFSDAAYVNLTEKQKSLYAAVALEIKAIANGDRESTMIELDSAALISSGYVLEGTFAKAEELESNVKTTWATVVGDFEAVLQALIVDHPFDFYWCGQYGYGYTYSYTTYGDGSGTYTLLPVFIFYADPDFRPAGYNEQAPTVDIEKNKAATSATIAAQAIVDQYAQKEDHEKIYGYIAEICALTDYNDDAAADMGSASTDNSPWQLLWVFDGDKSTNVVCEGYAKAFQYLCDLTTFKSDKVVSYLVTGNMTGGTGAGPHMWNVVTMDDGKNYIVDVTNSEEGTVGQEGQFVLGGTVNHLSAYDPTPDKNDTWGETYRFDCNSQQTMYFTYDANLPYTADQLKLASAPYVPKSANVAMVDEDYFTTFADALAAWMNPDATTLTLLANVETTTTINVEDVTKVLDLNGFVLLDARNQIAPTMNVYSDLTIMNTSNSGTGVIEKTEFDGGAIWTGGGSTLKIVGDVQITAGYAIEYAGDVDLREATSCIGWIVWHAGGTLTLPANIDLQLDNGELVHELGDSQTATIVAHNHVDETYANNGDGTHDVVCACGYVMQDDVPHDYVNGVCPCGAALVVAVADVDGVKFGNFDDAVRAWKTPEVKTLTLLADVETTETIGVEEGTKVLDLNGFVLIDARNVAVPMMDVYSDLTIMNTSNSGTGVIKKTDVTGAAIETWEGSTLKIVGDVKITAGYAIYYAGDVDLSEATSCIEWIVSHVGGTLTLPADTALKLYSGKLVHELEYNQTATIVAHNHVAKTYADNAGETHDVVCECGYVMEDDVPHDHVNGECPCGAKAVASVTISGTTTYHGTLYDALTAAKGQTATVTLLADCEINSKVSFESSSSNVTLQLNGQTITSSAELHFDLNTKLSIEGSGNFISENDNIALIFVQGSLNISGGNFTTTGENSCPIVLGLSGKVKISGTPTFSSSDWSEFSTHENTKLDLSAATPPTSNCWRVQCWAPNGMGMAVGTNLILPDNYVLQDADGNIVTSLGHKDVGTIVKHDKHTYVDGKCGCGEVCDHNFILDGTCDYCKLHFVADVSINNAPATPYATLKDALNAAKGQTATIFLLADCVLDEPFSFTSGSNVTLGLNDKTITGTASNSSKLAGPLSVDTGATLTIKGKGKYTYTNNGYAGIAVEGTLNIQSGTFEATQNHALVLHAKKGGEINISGGTFIVNNAFACNVQTDGAVNISGTPKFTVPADNTTAYEFGIGKNGKLNLADVTGNVVEGLRVLSWDEGVEVGPNANIILPDNYVLQDADGNIITSLDYEENGTIVKHTHVAKTYADNAGETHDVVCECGYVMEDNQAHDFVLDDGKVCACGTKIVAYAGGRNWHIFSNALQAWKEEFRLLVLFADADGMDEEVEITSDAFLSLADHTLKNLKIRCTDRYIEISGVAGGMLDNVKIVATRNGKVYICENVAFADVDAVNIEFSGKTLDLSRATIPAAGWKILCDADMHDQTIGTSKDSNIILPEGCYAFDANGKIVTKVSGASQILTVRAHEHAPAAYADNGDETHRVTCACGYELESMESHTYTEANREWKCLCGAKAVVDIDGSKFRDFQGRMQEWAGDPDITKMTLLANVETTEHIGVGTGEEDQNVLDLNGFVWSITSNEPTPMLGVYCDLTIMDTSNLGTGKLGHKNQQVAAIDVYAGKLKIIGNVKIDAPIAICFAGAVDLSKATSCIDWIVSHAGGTLTLPANTALRLDNGELVQKLEHYQTATIVGHDHDYTNYGHDENKHWKVCECGATNSVVDHDFKYVDNNDGKTHKASCDCGYTKSNVNHDLTTGECVCGAKAVADVDGVKFVNFDDAVAAWQVPTAKKLTLLADVQTRSIELTTDNGTQKVLELNGWRLELTASIALTNRISLTIQDSSETGKGSLYSNNQLAILVTNHGELNITGGTFEVTGSSASVIANEDEGTLCISGVTTLKNELKNRNRIAVYAKGTVTISGDVMIEASTAISCYGVVDVSGANNCVGWTVTNKGGTLTLPADTALKTESGDLVYGMSEETRGDRLTIEKHTHAAKTYTDNEDGTHKVTCACGYVLGINAPHTYTEVEDRVWECPCGAIAVADVDGKKYTDFEEAVYEWQQISAKNLTLLADVEHKYRSDVGGNGALPKVLDLNGYTWRTTGTKSVLRVVSDLTIKNTAESKEGVIDQPISSSYAIETDVGSSLKIIGNVEISAEMDIDYAGAVDLIEATNCIDWYVYNSGNNSTLTLPPNTALERFVGDLVQELQRDESGIIVEHTHNYTTYGHDETNHWKVCVCGATNSVEDHNYTNANNATHHWTACTCGVTTAQVAHDFKYVDNQDGKTHKVSCDCGYEKASVNHDISTGECVCGAKAVADVDDVKFVNFADAVTAWEAPTAKKLTLLDNVEYGDVISLKPDEAKTLELNGKTLTSTTSANFALYTACPLTINDSSTDRTGKFVADDIGECVVYCHGKTLTLNGGTITTNRASFVLELNGNTTTINSDNVKLSSNLAAIKVLNISNLTISGNGCDGWKIWNDSSKPSPIQIPNGFHLEDAAGNMLETKDKLPSEKYTVIKVDHIHNWTYAANDTADTITATCDAAGCPKPQQSMTLVAPVNLVYDGTAKTVTIDGSIEGVQMPSINITGDTTNVTEEGCTATITVAGVTATLSFQIVPADIKEATVSAEDQTYTGAAITPDEVSVSLDNKNLTLNTDYTVAYEGNENVGTATITVTGKGNYTGTATGEFNIKAASIEAAQITVADQIYTGKEITPEVIVILDNKNLTLNTDYTVAYVDNVNVGMAKVTINGKGNYTGTAEDTFTISLSGSALTAEAEAEYTYGGIITVTGTITATGKVPEQQSNTLRVVAPRVTLFCGETELGSAVVNDNAYTIEYNTMDKLLTIDKHTLTVEYSGDMNMAKSSTTVDVTLKAVELTITDAEAASRDYDTTNVVAVTGVTLNGILTGDEVSADVTGLTGTISSAYVGAYDNIILPALSLTGEDAAYYTLKQPEDAVATTVTISPKEVEASIELDEDTFVYDGTAKEPVVTAAKDGEHVIPATEYTVSYNNNTDVGTATVTLTDAEGGNYIVTGSKEFTIATSGAALTAEAKAEYTYGETITVTGTITATGEVPEQQSNKLRVVAPRVTLFYGETELGSAVVNGSTYTIEYDTTTKLLPVDKHTLTVKYSGSKNLADATATVTVSLMKAAPEYEVPAELTAVYGQTLVTVTLPDGWTWNESVNAVGNVGVNSHKATFTPKETDFYTTAEKELAVTVKPLPITDVTGPATKQLDVFCPTVEELIAQLPTTLPGIGSDGQKYDIPVEWSFDGDEFNDAPEAENNFTWTAQSGDPFEIPENAAGTTVVKNGSAMKVTITGENKNITYDGSTYNVSKMFIIDTNAGTAAYAITGGDGTGTLEGSELTITKAGTFTIQVTTQTNVKDGMPYAPGEATAILTVSKGVPAYTVPTGLTATYGQTLQEISLNGFAGWTWKETTTKVGDAGDNTHTAVFTPENTDLWNTAEADVIITVAKADIQLAGVVKTFLVTEEGETETAVFTYGDTITVKAAPVMPVMMALADEMAMPQPNQMALYCGSKQISAPADAVEGLYTLTYQTTDKALAAGENEILVKYIGTDNFNSGMMSLNVTINPAELSIADVAVKNRPYMQGNLFVEVTKVDLAGKKLDTDDVAADLIGLQASVESDAVGKYAEVVLAEKINLKGADASFYTVKGGVAIKLPEGTEVEITKAKPEPEGTPDMGNVAPSNQLGDVPTDPIEDLFDVPGNVTWNDPADTPVEPGKEYEWTFMPEDDENYEPVTGSTVLVPVAPPQPPVPPSEPVDLPQIIWPTQDQFVTLNNGDTVTMPVSAINADRYQWFVNRNDGTGYVPVSGANTASLTITVDDKDNGNVYLCRVGNANGTVMSPVFHLEVLPAVDVPPTGDTVNTMLWAALLMLSAAGLLLVRKIKVNLG